MTASNLLGRLAGHRTLGAAPREELAWLAANGVVRELNPGDILTAKGARVEGLFVVLSGCIAMFVDSGGGPNRIMEWRGGDVTGVLPYSRLVSPPVDSVALESTTILAVPRERLRDLIRECHEVTSTLVHTMIDRARVFTSSGLQDEKMVSLGKLSAGMAHELNNPVSAIERAAALLGARLDAAEQATRTPGASWFGEAQLAAVDALRASCLANPDAGVLSPIEQAAREGAVADWLLDHGLSAAFAEALAETAVTVEALDQLAGAVEGPVLEAALLWIASVCSVRGLAGEIQDAAMRISGLVLAIKGFTHMDQAHVAGPVDLMMGLTNTVTVLRSKARARSVTVAVDGEAGLPPVRGFAGEINQIWANLIENALDAAPEAGRVEVHAGLEREGVLVRIVDNGDGIPADNLGRIFDPFFTTKPVGQGTGLGLDIVRRLVRHNEGQITVESQPGRTEFRVLLPFAEGAGTP